MRRRVIEELRNHGVIYDEIVEMLASDAKHALKAGLLIELLRQPVADTQSKLASREVFLPFVVQNPPGIHPGGHKDRLIEQDANQILVSEETQPDERPPNSLAEFRLGSGCRLLPVFNRLKSLAMQQGKRHLAT